MTSPSHSSDEDFLEFLGISLDEVNVTVDANTHASVTGIYAQTWAFEYFPYTRPELIHADLGLGMVPLAWRWYRSNLHTVRRKKSLTDLRAFFDTCTLEQVPIGLVNQMMELILGMQQEPTSSWTLRSFDDQRRRRPRR
ncbi:hypothetical protein JCGZ_22694 [Jatropha curcas]|uniref:Aminotransferase-like plant mobile domain-containing protein n=1 Tax=Jatropha curcas TaxID=180498 RepID=A0A067JQW5_JATCU|nr:hypothetical protein JCGZ_22694 [Jatropha curcas]